MKIIKTLLILLLNLSVLSTTGNASPVYKPAFVDLTTLFPQAQQQNPNTVIKIPVLDQTQGRNGQQTCGYHAWKNALILLAASHANPKSDISLLTHKKFFNEVVFEYLASYVPKKQKEKYKDFDIDISALITATNGLVPKNDQAPKRLKHYAQYASSISFLNYFGPDSMDLLFTSGAGSISLIEIGKAYNALKNEDPLTHAFVVGGSGHWVALIMQKNVKGKITWLGCDSWTSNDVNKQLIPIQQYLLSLIEDIESLKVAIAPAYKELLPTLVEFAKVLKDDGTPIGDASRLVRNASQIEQSLVDLELSVRFLTDCALMNEEHFKDFTTDVKKLVRFYCAHLTNYDHPFLAWLKSYGDVMRLVDYLERFQKLSETLEGA